MAVIAPWLRAADTLGASEAGAQVGGEIRRQNLAEKSQADQTGQEQQRIGLQAQQQMQGAAQAAQSLQMEQQRLDAAQKQQGIENQLSREKLDRTYQLQLAREAVTAAYHQQQGDLAKMRLEQQGQKFAKHVSDLHMYNVGIAAGMSPKDLAQKFPDAFNGTQWTDILKGETGGPKLDPFDAEKLRSLTKLHDAAAMKMKTVDAQGKTVVNQSAIDDRNKYQKMIDELHAKYNQPSTPASGMDAALSQTTPPAVQGTVATPMGGAPGTPPPAPVQGSDTPPDADLRGTAQQPAPASAPKMFTDKSGKKFVYKGTAADPSTDKNPDSWEAAP